MTKFKVLNEKDLEILKLKNSELYNLDEQLYSLINSTKNQDDSPCCKSCDCSTYIQGNYPNPSTVCESCGHSWNVHRC